MQQQKRDQPVLAHDLSKHLLSCSQTYVRTHHTATLCPSSAVLLAGTRILSYMPAYKCKDGSASCISGTPNLGYLSGTSMAAPIVSGQVAMCYERGVCKSNSGSEYSKIVRPAGSYSRSNKRFGFNGDPYNSPTSGKYYGFLIYGNTY